MYSFTGGKDGLYPSGLVQGSDGNFYGTTYSGGPNGDFGTIFKISATGELTTLHAFTGGKDGRNPPGRLVQGSDGNFYGTTQRVDNEGAGTVYKISATGGLTTLYSFTGGKDGLYPNELVQGSDGYFYGTTQRGGTIGGAGTVFKISDTGALTTLYSFTGVHDGAIPTGVLVQGRDGNFYGTTDYANTQGGAGTIFRVSTTGALTTLHSFTGGKDGAGSSGLVQGTDGNFYGSGGGGAGGGGTVFRLSVVEPLAPAFQAVTLTNSTLSLTWTTEPGNVYQLQYNSDLNSTNWIHLRTLTSTGTALTFADFILDIILKGPQRFYRLVAVP